MKKRKENNLNSNFKRRNVIICFLLSFVVLGLSIGFSSFQNKLSIQDIAATVRIDKDVRIMGVSVNDVNDAISNYEEYNVSNITSSINLNSEESYIIYEIDVYNLGNVDVTISNFSIDNENLNAELIDYNIGDKICEDTKCNLGVKKKIKIKVSYKEGKYDSSITNYNLKIDFTFSIVYNVTYVGFDSTDGLSNMAIEGTTFSASFTMNSTENLLVNMNNSSLTSGSEYTYSDNILQIPDVDGNIIITISDMTNMKRKIITSFVDSGNEEDITLYDLDTMSSDDKTSTFGNIATDSGLIRTKGINGNSNAIIFRGNVSNNYVFFAGNIWRILQVDEDGNLRLILNNSIGSYQYNTTSSVSSLDEAETILGYTNSYAKTMIDTWYTSNLSDYSEYIVTSKFCNDFTNQTKTGYWTETDVYYFQSYLNIGSDSALYSPSLVCPSSSLFTSNIGLISAEEVVLAGGSYYKENTSYFLYSKSSWWTLSPGYVDTNQGNGGVFFVNSSGSVFDWSKSLLTASYGLRPVITIDGNLNFDGDGTLNNPYTLESEKSFNYTKIDVTDLATLEGNKYYIANTGGSYKVDGLLSSITSGIGLVGSNTTTFSDDKSTIISTTGTLFSFVNGEETTDGYLYQIMTDDGKYLTIGASDYSVTLSDTAVKLKVSLSTDSSYSGKITISDETGTMYLNFYGANNTSDDKFAGWNALDMNDYMTLYTEITS